MSIDPAIGLLLATAAALLFTRAAFHKLRDLPQFEATFAAYRVLPRAAARVLPVLELGVAGGLLYPASRVPAGAAAVLLLLAYALAITFNLRRGRRDLSCGCGGPDERTRIAPWMVARNLIIAGAVLFTLLPWGVRDWSFTDAVTVSFGLATLALVYQCVEQLMIHSERTFQWGRSR